MNLQTSVPGDHTSFRSRRLDNGLPRERDLPKVPAKSRVLPDFADPVYDNNVPRPVHGVRGNTGPVQSHIGALKNRDDYLIGKIVGDGSFSKVHIATDKKTWKEYAIKILSKRHIVKQKKVKYVTIERDAMMRLNGFPGIIRLFHTFQDDLHLYYVLDYAENGELLTYIKKYSTLSEDCVRFYAAEILMSLDLCIRMESSIVISQKITDFGTAKLLPTKYAQCDEHLVFSSAFVGTAEYVSPELIQRQHICKGSDLWAFACVVYQMITGAPPFRGTNTNQIFAKICNASYTLPTLLPLGLSELFAELFQPQPSLRATTDQVKSSVFFNDVVWDASVLWKQHAPVMRPYQPALKLNSSATNLAPNNFKSTVTAAAAANAAVAHANVSLKQHERAVSQGLPSTIPPRHISSSGHYSHSHTSSHVQRQPIDRLWYKLLLPNEQVLENGLIYVSLLNKSSGSKTPSKLPMLFFSRKKQRILLITSLGRCLFIGKDKHGKNCIETEIDLSSDGVTFHADEGSLKRFMVEDDSCTRIVEDPTGHAEEWVQCMKNAVSLSKEYQANAA
ncbi:AGC/PDK1 protein kinase Ppk21 [Schizosaccharomyces japonicus yFS275]|uniref:non-specific serine/threonine protein kinase n=1 Tax=Schizosaccharomyces japonicus (strain yFS275 / FY16936) TaxID=402676 RepID=B6K3A0_SCHJY|nr:AGC/PDK1 protein kinase Ppk21 [Schizosaccharomyces japonicus yFS275]EEB07957.2 AGC/PDK1 protein kinase Ppk21 [Schizosaccharomyces japonicus yFS275]